MRSIIDNAITVLLVAGIAYWSACHQPTVLLSYLQVTIYLVAASLGIFVGGTAVVLLGAARNAVVTRWMIVRRPPADGSLLDSQPAPDETHVCSSENFYRHPWGHK